MLNVCLFHRFVFELSNRDCELTERRMTDLKNKGIYTISSKEKEKLDKEFFADYTDEDECAQTIGEVFDDYGYVLDTHTAVAASVYEKYRQESEDVRKTVIASTASPYKFSRSVMTAIDANYEALEEFDLVDALEVISNVDIPNAVEEIRDAKILHTMECDADKMEETVKSILKV